VELPFGKLEDRKSQLGTAAIKTAYRKSFNWQLTTRKS